MLLASYCCTETILFHHERVNKEWTISLKSKATVSNVDQQFFWLGKHSIIGSTYHTYFHFQSCSKSHSEFSTEIFAKHSLEGLLEERSNKRISHHHITPEGEKSQRNIENNWVHEVTQTITLFPWFFLLHYVNLAITVCKAGFMPRILWEPSQLQLVKQTITQQGNVIYENDVGRPGEEILPREWSNKREHSPQLHSGGRDSGGPSLSL